MFNINSFPKKYALRRWTKEALSVKPDVPTPNVHDPSSQSNTFDVVIRDANYSHEYCVNRLANDLDKLMLYRNQLKELMLKADADILNPSPINNNAMMASMLGVTEPLEVTIHPPECSRNKGCGDHKRMKSKKELAMEEAVAAKKFRTCGKCGKHEGHNAKTCGKREGQSPKPWKI